MYQLLNMLVGSGGEGGGVAAGNERQIHQNKEVGSSRERERVEEEGDLRRDLSRMCRRAVRLSGRKPEKDKT